MSKPKIVQIEAENNTTKNNVVVEKDIFTLSPLVITDDKLLIVNEWGRKVNRPEPIIKYKGTNVALSDSYLMIKAVAKAGKTSICECPIASYLNPKTGNNMGFELKLYGRSKILFIDTEQSNYESQESYNRIMRRAGFDKNDPRPDACDKLIHINIKRLDVEASYATIEKILADNPDIGIMFIDVCTDLTPNGITDIADSIMLQNWLKKLSDDLAVVLTIHINENVKNTLNTTARGFAGKELERKCSCIIMLEMDASGNGKITVTHTRLDEKPKPVYYRYNKQLNMFTEIDYVPQAVDKKEKCIDEVKLLFGEQNIRSTEYLLKKFLDTHPNTKRKNFDYYMANYKKLKLVDNSEKKGQWEANLNV